ncbi:MAG: hypothetical protein QM772_07995 [Ottowia sp.]|uniref:hypothetical protein n=1 Tax=Ottowia sp. TaxID=1898956 RepID=UPI0039E64B5F
MSRTSLPLLVLVVGQLAACTQTLPKPPRPPAPAPATAPVPDDGTQGSFGGGGAAAQPAKTPSR